MSESTPQSAIVVAGIGATLQLFRLAADVIFTASRASLKAETKVENEKNTAQGVSKRFSVKRASSTFFFDGRFSMYQKNKPTGGTTETTNGATTSTTPDASHVEEGGENDENENDEEMTPTQMRLSYISALSNLGFFVYFLTTCVLEAKGNAKALYDAVPLGCTATAFFIALIINVRDFYKKRLTWLSRVLNILSTLILLLGIVILMATNSSSKITNLDIVSLVLLILACLDTLVEYKYVALPKTPTKEKKAKLSFKSIMVVLKPYFWPDATATSATLNRIRALSTWACVLLAKTCSLLGPIFLGRASTALAQQDYQECIRNVVIYVSCNFGGSLFKESQSLVYLKVAQAAFVQLAEVSFRHLHSLSLDWHLRKKLGEVIRSMDRGIAACDVLMKYMFLWLVPAIGECIVVVVIFATYFDSLALSVSVFFFVFGYMVLTIVITLWRKKFRKQVAKSDNDWHDRATDSLVNFETVKYFTAEDYEMKRFGESVETFQQGSVNVAASLSTLNISQQFLLQACLATSLSIATINIRDRTNCCLANGCLDGTSECCSQLDNVCSGMEIGDFVAVLTYTINLFIPLNFLGSVYNAIVMAFVDLANLSELLAEYPDIEDAPDAIQLPSSNVKDPDTVVEFDNVFFHYPTQSENSGLKGVSFTMKKGTITAVVGPTGAGKTTVSRLLFRFYDVLGGAVKVNGADVRIVTQTSLRQKIGVVPQTTNMFNDTLGNNIRYGRRDATQEELEEVAAAAQLTTFIESLPDGWDTMVGDRGLKLSGGEAQRTSIARCLLKNPPIVVLDEATSALDTITENSVQEALDKLGTDRTVLVIAHRLGTIRHADNIIVLDDGKVAEQGTHDELLALGGTYANMWNMQLSSTKGSMASFEGGLAIDESEATPTTTSDA